MVVDPSKPVHLIINPRSGYGGGQLALAELREGIRRQGYRLVEHTTSAPLDATVYAAHIVDDAAAVFVWGGDGTVNEVANGLTGSNVPFIPCHAGTENLFAKELRIPLEARRVADLLREGHLVECDVGLVNGRSFLLIVGVGFDGEVVRRLSAIRTGHISHLSYFWPIWRTFWEHEFPQLDVRADGENVFQGRGLVFVGNISRYAMNLRICRDARFNDGLLDLVVFPCDRQHWLMLHAAWTLLRMHPLKGDVIYRRIRTAHIAAQGAAQTQIDGDVGPSLPVDVRVADRRVRVVVPPRDNGRFVWPWELWAPNVAPPEPTATPQESQ